MTSSAAQRQGGGETGLVGAGLMALLLSLWFAASSHAVMYYCVDEAGARSFTDSPANPRLCSVTGAGPPMAPPDRDRAPSRKGTESQPRPSEPPPSPETAIDPRPSTAALGQVTVPLQHIGGSLVITVRLNGERQAQLILDTGATLTLLSRAIARDLGLYSESPSSSAVVNTAGGQVAVDVMRISAIEVGGAAVRNVPVAIFDLPDAPPTIEGLLGLSFLSHFLVTLDLEQSELRLTPR